MPAPYFVSTGVWGSGLGRPLHVAEFDGNTYAVDQRLAVLEAGGGLTTVSNITAAGSALTFHLSDATTYTVTIPLSEPSPALVGVIEANSVGEFTPSLADANRYLRSLETSDVAFVLPVDGDLEFPVGTEFHLRQAAVGAISVVGSTEEILINPAFGCDNITIGIGATITLKKVADNEWDVIGGQLVAVSA